MLLLLRRRQLVVGAASSVLAAVAAAGAGTRCSAGATGSAGGHRNRGKAVGGMAVVMAVGSGGSLQPAAGEVAAT